MTVDSFFRKKKIQNERNLWRMSEKKFCDQFEKEDLERAYRDLDVNGDGEVDCKDFSEVSNFFLHFSREKNFLTKTTNRSFERAERSRLIKLH